MQSTRHRKDDMYMYVHIYIYICLEIQGQMCKIFRKLASLAKERGNWTCALPMINAECIIWILFFYRSHKI